LIGFSIRERTYNYLKMLHTSNPELKFLRSALTEENPYISTEGVIEWLKQRNNAITVNVRRINFNELVNWEFSTNQGNLQHSSGRFFSVEGIRIKTNYGNLNEWEQPILNQPEIGYLGFITKEINGILYFLTQAKIEPGNVNNVQLSPTLQATKSNYSQVHNGKRPTYLEYFRDRGRCDVLLDQLQSEQGARFLRKRNRNIIILTEEDIPVHEDFIWLTLGQIKKLIRYDNLVNMDTRTVISGIPFGGFNTHIIDFFKTFQLKEQSEKGLNFLVSSMSNDKNLHTTDEVIAWFTELKCKYDLEIERIPLSSIKDWIIEDNQILHVKNRFFKIIAADVEISNREVSRWMQPLVEPAQEGLIAFIVKKINGTYHFLVQAKLESGNFDILEMAPTVQCLTGNYRNTKKGALPFLEYILEAPASSILYDSLQSEEGGRFYHEQNRNLIIEADDLFDENLPDHYFWMTLNQLHSFLKYNNYLNIQARSLISVISFI